MTAIPAHNTQPQLSTCTNSANDKHIQDQAQTNIQNPKHTHTHDGDTNYLSLKHNDIH